MTTCQLHEFDKLLCGQVIWNLRVAVDEYVFPTELDRMRPELKAVTLDSNGYSLVGAPTPELLLNEDELSEISEVVRDTLELVPWEPLSRQYQEATLCTGEVRRRLAPSEAEVWAASASRFTVELESGSLTLAEGVEVVSEWTRVIRRYLEAMEQFEFLPRPIGPYPTPSLPVPGKVAVTTPPEFEYVVRMRDAIAQHPDGPRATADELLKLSKSNRRLGRKALRVLQQQGEYSGFRGKTSKRSPIAFSCLVPAFPAFQRTTGTLLFWLGSKPSWRTIGEESPPIGSAAPGRSEERLNDFVRRKSGIEQNAIDQSVNDS